MSKPAPGNYIIYNRVLGHTGQKLAITFTGQDKPATVTPLSYTNEQVVRYILFRLCVPECILIF